MPDYDYIIIGAGSAGCVLADLLSADPRHRVLVLEAGGPDRHFWVKMPLGYAYAHIDPRITVNCGTEPDTGLAGRRSAWPRGRVVGGCSSINAMAYMRGLPFDFEDWAASGATGWDWSAVSAVYDRLEAKGGHTRSGVIHISDLSQQMHPFSDAFLRAAQDIGWPVLEDLNTGAAGIGYYRSTIRNGRRWSAADAFLRPALKRGRVRLETRAKVTRIEIANGIAQGVTYRQHGQMLRANARREIILSAGAIHSPQILQLSGIGPGALLQTHGIPVQNALPEVGRGLQDHLAVSYSFTARPETLNARLGTLSGRLTAGMQYLAMRSGPLAVPVNQVGGYIASQGAPRPDTQIYCNPMLYSYGPKGPEVTRASGYILCAQPCRPGSRGEIRIISPSADDEPGIWPNSLSTEADCRNVIQAGRLLQRLARSDTLMRARRAAIGPDLLRLNDDMLLEDFRARAATVFHPSCTCRMGNDPAHSVLDARLRVHGTDRLRVVDASAFPNITSGNTNAPTMMLAARAAELILADRN